jgi:hypothetical protein
MYTSDMMHIIDCITGIEWQVKPETVGQFTGLKDKSGYTEIYDGDIISLNGIKIGNRYENSNLLAGTTNILIEGLGTKEWSNTEQKAFECGCKYA